MGSKILVVDDSRTVRRIVRTALRPYACEIIEAGNGAEGLAIAGRERPDLILLDVMMPVMGGREMLAWLRNVPAAAGIPVILLAAAGPPGAAGIEGCDVLSKPFNCERLIERVGRILALQSVAAI